MKLVYKNMEHIISFDHGYVNELVIENKKMFFDVVNNATVQSDGGSGDFLLSVSDKPVDFSRYADVTVQFAPFQINRKSLLTKLYASLEQKAMLAENYKATGELLAELERYVLLLSDDLPFEVDCQRLSIGPIIKAVSPEIDETDKTHLEKIFAYMELVRELDRDRLFIMINMRTYFSDDEMETFVESVCLHGFKVLLIENSAQIKLKNTKRYTVDEDLCEF
ncbi:MAG: type II-A CRISPR-associated protein Csn2 [Eubacteriales bacterium]